MSFANLENEVTRQTEAWVSERTPSGIARLAPAGVRFDLEDLNEGSEHDIDSPPLYGDGGSENGACSTPALSLRTASVGSFRAPALIHQSNGATIPPSLASNSLLYRGHANGDKYRHGHRP